MLIGSGLRMSAQLPSQSGEGQNAYQVGTITVKFLGTANVSEEVVRANMQIREGGVLDDAMIDNDIRALYRTGLFEFIEVKRETASPGVFNLVVEVTPKFRVLAVKYEGNNKVRAKRLDKEIKTRPNMALDERQIKEDSEKIREYYQKTGYNQVSVNYTIERDRSSGFGTVIFNIRENNRTKNCEHPFRRQRAC
jgi:outer membrane protein insertion porin family